MLSDSFTDKDAAFFVVSIDYFRQEQILRGKDSEKKKIKPTLISTVENSSYSLKKKCRFSKLLSRKL